MYFEGIRYASLLASDLLIGLLDEVLTAHPLYPGPAKRVYIQAIQSQQKSGNTCILREMHRDLTMGISTGTTRPPRSGNPVIVLSRRSDA